MRKSRAEIHIFFPLENNYTKDSLPAFLGTLPPFCSLHIARASGTALPVSSPPSASPPVFSPAAHNRCSMTFDLPGLSWVRGISPHINSFCGWEAPGCDRVHFTSRDSACRARGQTSLAVRDERVRADPSVYCCPQEAP